MEGTSVCTMVHKGKNKNLSIQTDFQTSRREREKGKKRSVSVYLGSDRSKAKKGLDDTLSSVSIYGNEPKRGDKLGSNRRGGKSILGRSRRKYFGKMREKGHTTAEKSLCWWGKVTERGWEQQGTTNMENSTEKKRKNRKKVRT